MNLPTTGHCNSNRADGLIFDNNSFPDDIETLPWIANSNNQALRTGSLVSRQCVSRYGIQDLTGNVWEWTSDQATCDPICHGVDASLNSVDPQNDDFRGLKFDGNEGPTSSLLFSDAGKIELPIAIPIVGSFSADGVMSWSVEKFHQDYLQFFSGGGTYGAICGGGWLHGGQSGRYLLYLNHRSLDNSYERITARCCMELD